MKTIIDNHSLCVKLHIAIVAIAASCLADTTITPNGSELTYDVPQGETYDIDEAFPASATTIIKTGKGTLQVNAPNTGRSGLVIDIRQGTVKSGLNERVFGASDTVKVSPGASLWYTGKPANLWTYIFGTVEIAGDGPDHNGAFYYTGSGGSDIMINTLKVISGAKIGGTGRFGARITNMGGNTLTNEFTSTDNPYMFRYFDWIGKTQIIDPGNIVQLSKKCIIQGSSSSAFDVFKDVNSDSNSWRFDTASLINLLWENAVFPWRVSLAASLTLQFSGVDATLDGLVVGEGAPVPTLTVTTEKAFDQTLTINANITNVNLEVMKTNITVKVRNSDLYCRLVSMVNGGVLDVDGGTSQKIVMPWGIARFYKGASVRFCDAGTIWMPNAFIYVGNETFATDRMVPSMCISGDTTMALTDTAFPQPRFLVGSYYSDTSGIGSTPSGWGTLSVRNGASVTNGVMVGRSGVGALYLTDANFYVYPVGCFIGTATAAKGSGYGAFCSSNANLVVKSGMTVGGGEGSVGHYVQFGGKGCHDQSSCVLGGKYANFYLGAGARFDMRETFADPNGASVFHFGRPSVDTSMSGESVFTCDNNSTCIVGRAYTAAMTNRTTQINLNNGGCFVVNQMWYSPDRLRAPGATYRLSFNGGVLDYQVPWTTPDILTDAPDRMVVHKGGAFIGVAANCSLSSNGAFVRPCGKSIKSISLPTDADFLAATNIGPAHIVFEGAGEGMTAFIAYNESIGRLGDVIISSAGEGCDETTRAYAVIPQYPDRLFPCALEIEKETGGDLVKFGAGSLTLSDTNTYSGATIVREGTLVAGCDYAIPSNTTVRLEGGKLNMNSKHTMLKTIEGTGGSISGISGNVLTVDHLSTIGMNGATFPANGQISIVGDWMVDAEELLANKMVGKVANYAASVQFQPGSTISFSGIERLAPALSPYPICSFEGGSRTGLPQLVGEALPGPWRFRATSRGLSLVHPKGTVLVIK